MLFISRVWFILIVLMTLVVATTSSFSKTIEFVHSASNQNATAQTAFLLDTNQLVEKGNDHSTIQLITRTDMFQVSKLFDRLIFITFKQKSIDYKHRCDHNYQRDYLLDLTITSGSTIINSIQLNVRLINEVACPVLASNIKLSIEYIFQLGNASDYGLIKDDMSKNGIVGIVKIKAPSKQQKLELQALSDKESEYLAIKKFLPNFYMVRLVKSLDMAVDPASFEMSVHVIGANRVLESAQLKFKLVRANDLQVQFKQAQFKSEDNSVLHLNVNNYFRAIEFSDAYLYQIQVFLAPYLFSNAQDYKSYVDQNLKFSLVSSTSSAILLDPHNGHVLLKSATRPSANSQPTIRLNISVSDRHKLFRASNIQLYIQVTNVQEAAQPIIHHSKQIIERTLRRTVSGLISFQFDQYSSINEFSRIHQCWINGQQSQESAVYVNLNNKVFNAFGRDQSQTPRLIECQLTERNVWLKFYVLDELQHRSFELVQVQSNIDIDRFASGMVLDVKSLVSGLKQMDQSLNGQLLFTLLYEDYLTKKLFRLDRLNGYVYYTAKPELAQYLDIVKLNFNVKLVEMRANLSVDLDKHDTPFLMQDTNELYSKDLSVFVTMATGKCYQRTDFDSQLELEEFIRLDKQFRSVKITKQGLDMIPGHFEIFQLVTRQPSSMLEYNIKQVYELDFSELLTDKLVLDQRFHIMNQTALIYSPLSLSRTVFQLSLEACVPNAQCHKISVTLAISIDLDVQHMQFLRPIIQIESASDQLELKRLIKQHQFYDLRRVRFTIAGNQACDLNPQTGLLIINRNSTRLSLNTTIVIASTGEQVASASLEIVIKLLEPEATALSIDKSILVNPSVPSTIMSVPRNSSKVICRYLSQSICTKLFPIDPQTSLLNLNQTILFQFFTKIGTYQQLIIKQDNKKQAIHLNLSIQKKTEDRSSPKKLDLNQLTNLVTYVNSSDKATVRVTVNGTKGSDYLPQVLRVKNIVTGMQVIGLEYVVALDSAGYFIQVNNMRAVDLDQLYAFDLSFGKQEETKSFASFYLIHSKNAFPRREERIHQTLERLYDHQLVSELATTIDRSNSLEQTIYIINHVNDLNRVKNLRGYFHVEPSSGQLWLTQANEEFYGNSIEIQLVKFSVDKISLKITKSVVLDVTLQVVKSIKQQQQQSYFIQKQVLMSRLTLNQKLAIHTFNYSTDLVLQSTSSSSSQQEKRTLPFELINGKIVVASRVHESSYSFEVLRVSSNELFYIEIEVVNDDPIVEISGNARQVFRVQRGIQAGDLIGAIDMNAFLNISQAKNDVNLTYSLIGMDRSNSRVQVTRDTGLLFAGQHIDRVRQTETLLVQVKGHMGHRQVVAHLNLIVLVVDQSSDIGSRYVIDHRQLNSTWNRPGDIFDLGILFGTEQLRYKLIPNLSGCQLNWLNGQLACQEWPGSAINVLIYHETDEQILHLVQVNMQNAVDSMTTTSDGKQQAELSSVYPIHQNISVEVSARDLTPGYLLTILRQEINLVAMETTTKETVNDCRFHFIPSAGSAQLLSSYFKLDSVNGNLRLLKRPTIESRLRQQISLVQLIQNKEATRFRVNRLINVELTVTDKVASHLEQLIPTTASHIDAIQQYPLIADSYNIFYPTEIHLDLPVLVLDQKKQMKLFQLNQNSTNIAISAESHSSNLISISANKWVSLDSRYFDKQIPKHSLTITAYDEISGEHKLATFHFNLVQFSAEFSLTFTIELPQKNAHKPIRLNLKEYFPSSYPYLALNDPCFAYSPQTGQIRTTKSIRYSRTVSIKLFSQQSDITMATIQVNVLPRPTLTKKLVHLYISNRVPTGSTIYTHKTRIISHLNQTDFFKLDQNRVLLNKPLSSVDTDFITCDLVLYNFIVSLRVHILENNLERIQFQRPVYYFSDKQASTNKIGSLQLTPMTFIRLKFIQLQARILPTASKCIQPPTSSKQGEVVPFTITKDLEIQLNLNGSFANDCDLYEIKVQATLSTTGDALNITRETRVYIRMTRGKYQRAQLLAKLEQSYSKTLEVNDAFSSTQKSAFSIDLFEIMRATDHSNSNIRFHVSLLDTTLIGNSIGFTVSSRSGLLILKLNAELKQFMGRCRFRISLLDDIQLLGQFTLNVYLHNRFSMDLNRQSVFFTNDYYEYNNGQVSNKKISVQEILYNPFNETRFSVSSNSGWKVDEDSLDLSPASGAMTSMAGIHRVELQVCNEHLACDRTTLFIQSLADWVQEPIRTEHTTTITTTTKKPDMITTAMLQPGDLAIIKTIKKEDNTESVVANSTNLIIFTVLVSLIVSLSIVTIITLFCLSQVSCCQSQSESESASRKYNSRKTLELSMNSDNIMANGSITSSTQSDGSFSCHVQTMQSNGMNQQRGTISVSNLLANQIQESYFFPPALLGDETGAKGTTDCGIQSEFEMLRFTLNWEPSYDQFKTVIGEFEQFPRSLLGCGAVERPSLGTAIYHDTDTNPYEQYADGQTFV